MPGPFQATFYFDTIDNEGWTENLFFTATDIDAAATTAAEYPALRLVLSPNNVDMVYAKVSDTTIKGDSKIVTPPAGSWPIQGSWAAVPDGSYLEANTALLIEMIGSPTKKNRLFLRGLSLDVVTGREFKAPAGFVTALTALTTWLVSNAEIRTADKPLTHPPTYTFTPVTDAFFTKVTARKPGRPFGGPRGRKFAHRTAALAAGRSSTSSALATQHKPASPPVPRR